MADLIVLGTRVGGTAVSGSRRFTGSSRLTSRTFPGCGPSASPRPTALSAPWSAPIIAKIFQADPIRCRHCGGPLEVVAYADSFGIRKILDHLDLSSLEKPPPPEVREVVRVPSIQGQPAVTRSRRAATTGRPSSLRPPTWLGDGLKGPQAPRRARPACTADSTPYRSSGDERNRTDDVATSAFRGV